MPPIVALVALAAAVAAPLWAARAVLGVILMWLEKHSVQSGSSS